MVSRMPLHTCATILMLDPSMTGHPSGSGSTQSGNICQTTCHNDNHRFIILTTSTVGTLAWHPLQPTAAPFQSTSTTMYFCTTIRFGQPGRVPGHRYTPLPCRVSLDMLFGSAPSLWGRSPHVLRMSVRPSVVQSLAVAHGRFTHTS